MTISVWMKITGIISCISCFLVCLIYFTSLKVRKQKFNQVVFFIAISDICSSIGMSLGLQKNNTIECWIQTILTNICPLWSMFWTTVIAFVVYGFFSENQLTRQKDIPLYIHMICWLIPIIVTFLILSTNTFGCNSDDDDVECWCFVGNRSNSPSWTNQFWVFFSFYIWAWISLLIYLFVFIYALLNIHKISGINHGVVVGVRSLLIKKLIGYPLIITICWAFSSFYDIYITINPNSAFLQNRIVIIVYTCLPSIQGCFTAVIFLFFHFYSMKSQQFKFKFSLKSYQLQLQQFERRKIHAEIEKVDELSISNRIQNRLYDPILAFSVAQELEKK